MEIVEEEIVILEIIMREMVEVISMEMATNTQ